MPPALPHLFPHKKEAPTSGAAPFLCASVAQKQAPLPLYNSAEIISSHSQHARLHFRQSHPIARPNNPFIAVRNNGNFAYACL